MISEKLTELIAQKERIASEVNTQSGLISQIKTVLEQKASEEIPKSKWVSLLERTITEVTAEDLKGVTALKGSTFGDCANLVSVTIPPNVTSFSNNTFYNCKNLSWVNYLGTLEQWCNITFGGSSMSNGLQYADGLRLNGELLTSLVFPSSLTEVKAATFSCCKSLTSITLHDNITIINDYAFNGCEGLTSVVIPNSVEKIKGYAFAACKNLASITIGSGVTNMGGNSVIATGTSTTKTVITMLPTTPPTLVTSSLNSSYISKIIVPKGCGDTYKSATNWSKLASLIEEATA